MWSCVDVQLKPYVSYRVSNATQSEFTARDLFDATYGKVITDEFRSGKLDPQAVTVSSRTSKSDDNK